MSLGRGGNYTPSMVELNLLNHRLRAQHLIRSPLRTPNEVVGWFGAMQAQDVAGAMWAIGRRALRLSQADVARAFDDGAILRTHVLRPTWHFVTPADIRWWLRISAPRVHVMNGFMYRQCELDGRLLSRAHQAIARALDGGRHLTRADIGAALARARIQASGHRLAYVMVHAELEGLVCSGPVRGRQFTYALLDDRAPAVPRIDADEALARLTARYFTSHGPATLRDYVWWSGLTVRQARQGIEASGRSLASTTWDGRTYWSAPSGPPARRRSAEVWLLPNYDEFLIAYRDRQLAADPRDPGRKWSPLEDGPHQLVIDGRVRGSWTRTITTRDARLGVRSFRPLTRAEERGLRAEVTRFGTFLGLPARRSTDGSSA